MSDNSELLLKAKPFDLMMRLSVPAIIGMVVVGLYPLVDGIFAGQILGEKAMAAIGTATPFTYLNTGIATLIGVGSASILSRALGKKDQNTLDKIMGNLLVWVLLFSVCITAIGVCFSKQLLMLIGSSGEILALGTRYLRIIFVGSVFVNFAQAANMVMRGEGMMKRAMLIMGLGAAINIILDPILMISMGERGIEGAALATVTAQIIQALVTFYYFRNKSELVKIKKIRIEKSIYKAMFSVGVSAMLMQILALVQQSFLYSQAFQYGGDSMAAIMSAALRIQAFSFIPLWGMSQGLQPAIGANYGAKQYDRVRIIFRYFAIGATILAACFWIPGEVFTRPILALFGLSQESLSTGVLSFRIMYSIFISYGLMIMMMTFFQAIGDGKSAGLMVMLRQVILFIPAVLLLPLVLGSSGIWLVFPIVDGIVVIIGLAMYLKSISRMGIKNKN